MSKFVLLNCRHYMQARRTGVAPGQAEYCWKCSLTRVIKEVHSDDYKIVCKDCRYSRRAVTARQAYGVADRHFQDQGHQVVILVDHPSVPEGCTLIHYLRERRGAEQLELPIPF